jgi:hypothetical protein
MRANILDRRGFAMVAATLAFAGFLALSMPVLAQSGAAGGAGPVTSKELYVAYDVPVDETAGNVTEARDRGLTQGQVAGFRKVVERVVAREDWAQIPQLGHDQIVNMVRDFSIANERSSAVRYLADLTVRFDPEVIRRLLRTNNVPFTETISKPLVVVPLMREGAEGRWMLWGDNAWRKAWEQVPKDVGLVPLIVPLGNNQDVAALTTEQAAAKDLAALNALAALHGANGTLIATATVVGDAIHMSLSEQRADLPAEDVTLIQAGEAGQTPDEILVAAAHAAALAVNDTWKQSNRIAFGGTTQITALVPVGDLKEWLTVRKRLDDVQLIDHIELQAVTRDRAQVTLHYAGAQRQLELAMSQHDLSLAQQNGVWIIQARDAASAARVLGRPGETGAETN